MEKFSFLILKVILILIGLMVLSFFLIVVPDEVNIDKNNWILPILAIMYISTIPFFFALFQTIKLIKLVEVNLAFSNSTVNTLKLIKYSAIAFTTLYILGMPYMFYVALIDDAPGLGAISLILIFGSAVAGTIAAILQKVIQKGIDLKFENDLTV